MDDAAARDALRRVPYGLYVCTTKHADGGDHGFVLSWLTQVSFKPRLVAIGVNTAGRAHGLIERSRVFCVNMLARDSRALVIDFLKPHEGGSGTFGAHGFKRGPETGCAVLAEAVAWIECKVQAVLKVGGDHEVIVGEVVGAGTRGGPQSIASHESTGLAYGG